MMNGETKGNVGRQNEGKYAHHNIRKWLWATANYWRDCHKMTHHWWTALEFLLRQWVNIYISVIVL
jgi:hypothetical protein